MPTTSNEKPEHELEARPRPGGRIRSLQMPDIDSPDPRCYRFDMGPSWFWPECQPELTSLIQDMQLPYFAQYEEGDMMFEESPHKTALRTTGYKNVPASMRLEQGTEFLIDSLLKHIPKERLGYEHTVSAIRMQAMDSHLTPHPLPRYGQTAFKVLPANGLLVFQAIWPELSRLHDQA